MPTPFTHLRFAQDLLAAPALAPEVRAALQAERPAFLFGSVAPDVQTLSAQPREATHFYAYPLQGRQAATDCLLKKYPQLQPRRLAPPQAAFMAGYLTHLVMDQLWITRIFDPVFGFWQLWGAPAERAYLHNVLRAHLDVTDRAGLSADTADCLRAVQPAGWLPFVTDAWLTAWRDQLAEQLAPGGAIRTIEVFAQRSGADPQAFAALLAAPEELHTRVLARLRPDQLEHYAAETLADCLRCLHASWAPPRSGAASCYNPA